MLLQHQGVGLCVTALRSLGLIVAVAACGGDNGVQPGPPPNLAEPVYSASNPDHVLHVYENWSTHTTISQLGTALRVDGGPPWQNAGIQQYGAVVDSSDGFGSVRFVTTEYQSDPPINPHGTGVHAAGKHWYGGGSPANGFQGTLSDAQGDDNADPNNDNTAPGDPRNNRGFKLAPTAYRNKPTRSSVVYEWAVRMRGTNWFEGKDFDINGGVSSGVGRFNNDVQGSRLGGPANCASALCQTYYSNNGLTPLFSNLPPTYNSLTRSINRDNADLVPILGYATVPFKQNLNYGSSAGLWHYGRAQLVGGGANADAKGLSTPVWQAGWLYFKLQITKQAPGQGFGNGRIEMWVRIADNPGVGAIKIMEYLGDVGARDAGNIYVSPNATDELLVGQINIYELASRLYTGGAIVDIGTIRIWSHSR